MGDLSGEASIEIAAPVDRCFAIAADVERAPEWQGAMRSARALQSGAGGRPVLVETEIDALVAKVTLLLRFDYDEPGGLRWRREGGDLKGLQGSWRFAAAGDGRTLATRSFPGATHGGTVEAAAADSLRWLRARLRG